MDHPSQVFDRVRRRKARPGLSSMRRNAPAPAPTGPAAPIHSAVPEPTPAAEPPSPAPAALPARGHALYSQVMRSHDRMGTRHV